ncbi:MAG: hypothetical protein Q7R41_07630, partial [Phycisphaerales bacterium]|nr:hypothetical protein [Phycisphaerales bacterium]
VRLDSGRVYYVEALMKEGGGGDNLAVRWRRPDGIMEEPIPGSRLLPWGISFTPPAISQHPANTTVMEGDPASFTVKLSTVGSATYQWQSNLVNIAGANASTYTIPATPLSADTAKYRVIVSNSLGTATSSEATLRVTPDSVKPTIVAIQNIGATTLSLTFSEPMDVATATAPGNYGLNNTVFVVGASMGNDPRVVTLTTSAMTFGTTYVLTVRDVTDRAVTANKIEANTTRTFLAVEYAPLDIGGATTPGTATPVSGGFDVQGAGSDISGVNDQFHFEYQQRTGNFDVKVRLDSFSAMDPWAKAGLMARESLTSNSRFAAALATPATVGCFFASRSTAGAAATIAGNFPPNYPEMWLRLQRSGNAFTAYAGFDGQTWTSLGSATIAMPSTLYFGMAVASRSPGERAQVRFRDIAPGTGGVVAPYVARNEPLGPSSRRTGLVISEMMYHPKDRADGK